jgi:hypothetical protein
VCLNNNELANLMIFLSSLGSSSCCSLSCGCFGSGLGFSLQVIVLISCPVSWVSNLGNFIKTGTTLRTYRIRSVILRSNFRLFTIFPIFHELLHAFISQIFVEIFVVDLDHGSVDASTETLDFVKGEKAIFWCFAFPDVGKVWNSLDDVASL